MVGASSSWPACASGRRGWTLGSHPRWTHVSSRWRCAMPAMANGASADPLARVDGVLNALTLETDPVGQVTIVGPGAGRELAGQGLFADLVATIRQGASPGLT